MSFGTKQVTEKAKGGFISKKLIPGMHRCKVNGIYTKEVEDRKKGGTRLQLWLSLESEPIGDNFQGWAIDNDPSKGYHLGQIGNVKSNPYGYKTETINGTEYNREASIAFFLHILCLEAADSKWVEEADGKYATFEEFIAAFNAENPIKDVFLDFCIAGNKTLNKEGYVDYWLNLPKANKGEKVFMNPSKVGNLVQFDQVLHVYDSTNREDVAGFSPTPLVKNDVAKPQWNDDEEDDLFNTETKNEEDPFALPSTGTDDEDPFDFE